MVKLSTRGRSKKQAAAEKLAAVLAEFNAIIVDSRLKIHLTQDKTQCRETLARLVFVLAIGTDIGIIYDQKAPNTKSMHVALLSVAQMAVDGNTWDAACKEFLAHAVELAATTFMNTPKGGIEALPYASYLSDKVRQGTLKIADLASLEIYS